MIVIFFLGLISSTWALTLLDLHEDEFPLRTYSRDNLHDNDDGTISLTEYSDADYDVSQNSRSRSIPIIEAPVAMSNPIWKIFTRASDLYRIFRRSSQSHSSTNPEGLKSEDSDSERIGVPDHQETRTKDVDSGKTGSKSSFPEAIGYEISSPEEIGFETLSPGKIGSRIPALKTSKTKSLGLATKKIAKNPHGWRLFLR
ncbi:hypothetical protein FO519_002306 [Halicephalobus sp. NKZ332]|nr:hypothetical protein FO519_002306 [Halicephalobus sp. NKZ332]